MRKDVQILAFHHLNKARLYLHGTVFGSAMAGNKVARAQLQHPPAELTDRILFSYSGLSRMALRVLIAWKLWQSIVGRMNQCGQLPSKMISRMLGCVLPDMKLFPASKSNRHSCRFYWECPMCFYRQVVSFYNYLASVVKPGMKLVTYEITSMPFDLSDISYHDVAYMNVVQNKLYNNHRLNWDYGVTMAFPKYVSRTTTHEAYWAVTARTVALLLPTTVFKGVYSKNSVEDARRRQTWYTHKVKNLGSATEDTILKAVGSTYSYPAPRLWGKWSPEMHMRLHAIFCSATGPRYRARRYGIRKQEFELLNEGAIDVESRDTEDSHEHSVCGRLSPETADLEFAAGNKG